MSQCTCNEPPCVNLTVALEENNETKRRQEKEVLRKVLERWGWCHVSVDRSRLPIDSSLHAITPNLKDDIERLFDTAFLQSLSSSVEQDAFNHQSAVYRGRTAESGASLAAKPEPKQSWETKRCHCFHSGDDSLSDASQSTRLKSLHQWTKAMHLIAVMVTRVLELPPNLLLRQDSCKCNRSEGPCNIDLLRVFYYDAVEESNVLGSSPHSDWGGWTVVWQDQVGGLQTYCCHHDHWVDVPPAPSTKDCSNQIRFVVHVGDVTSLAMGRAASTHSSATVTEEDSPTAVVWPSPRHQVVCPTNSIPRASLVYFAYPPPGVSLQDMENSLMQWWSLASDDEDSVQTTGISIPYERYSLLQNQAAQGISSSPTKVYKRIRSRPLDAVFDEKWQQVQRR